MKTNIIMMLMSDTYKQTHPRMYPRAHPNKMKRLVSYLTPRKNMSDAFPSMVFWGLQPFMVDYLVDGFNKQFFDLPLEEVEREYKYYMDIQVGVENVEWNEIAALHKLGYLPLEIRALPEGTVVNMGIPVVEMRNTHPDFAWVVQWVECVLQGELWAPCAYATVGKAYHELAEEYYKETTDGADPFMAMADFGMRGMSCMEDAIRASASWLLSFNKTSTIPALPYVNQYYGGQCAAYGIGRGAVSTEHSVMGANFAIDGDEITFVKRLLTELYPNTSFSMVSDTYDYWNMVENIIPACKDEILAHNGKLLIRPDSGDMVKIAVRTIESLWKDFGGTINSKGYKELDPHIGMIYGDGCALNKVRAIYSELKRLGYAASNIVFGVGAFCFHALFDQQDNMTVITRDTFGMAMKATFGEFGDNKLFIYKDPKTDEGNLKKSHKGCCMVSRREDGSFVCVDEFDHWIEDGFTELETVFKNGQITKFYDFMDVRRRIYG